MSDFESELDEKLSTPAGRNWIRRRLRDAMVNEAARIERDKVIGRLSQKSHEELRTCIEVAEIGEPSVHAFNLIGIYNEALDRKGRTTKDEAARLSPFGISYLTEASNVYYDREKKQMYHYRPATNSFHKINFCSHEHRGTWKPLMDKATAIRIKGES